MVRQICVVGAGIIGCSTAVYLQQTIPNIEVTIISEEFSPNLTSDIAAGHIEPYVSPPSQQSLVAKWTKETIDYIKKFMRENPNCGAQEYSGYLFQKDSKEPPFWAGIMPNFIELSPEEVKERHPFPQSAGFFFSSLYLEPTKHLDHLMKTFLALGGKCRTQKLTALSDVGEIFDVVVNCSGLGSRFLLGDKELIPVRGQIIKVHAPHIKHFFMDDDFYTLLNDNCVILGGTRDYDQWDRTVDPKTVEMILKGNEKRIPSLKNARVLSHHVGLRPYRKKVRIEVEKMDFGRRKVPVVHNYGHGGSGVTIFWGCAKEAAQLVAEVLSRSKM